MDETRTCETCRFDEHPHVVGTCDTCAKYSNWEPIRCCATCAAPIGEQCPVTTAYGRPVDVTKYRCERWEQDLWEKKPKAPKFWENCSTCGHGEVCESCPGFGKSGTKYELRKPQPDPVLTAAKALLTFLEDKSTNDICTGGTSEDPEIFEFDRYDLVAYPDAELTKLQEALEEAIGGAERG